MGKLVVCVVFSSVLLIGGCKRIDIRQNAEVKENYVEVKFPKFPVKSCPSWQKALIWDMDEISEIRSGPVKSWGDLGKKTKQRLSFGAFQMANLIFQILSNPYEYSKRSPINIDFYYGIELKHKDKARNITRLFMGGRDQKSLIALLDFMEINQISCEDMPEKKKLALDVVVVKMNFPKSTLDRYQSIYFHGEKTHYVVMKLTDKRMEVVAASGEWRHFEKVHFVRELFTEGLWGWEMWKGAKKMTLDRYEVSADGGIINHEQTKFYKGEEPKHTVLLRNGVLVGE